MIDELIKKMLVGNESDRYSGLECEVVLREIIRRSNAGEALIKPQVSDDSEGMIVQLVASA